MKKYQIQTIKMSLEEERKVLNSLKKEYTEAKKQVKKKIDDLMSRGDANLPHVIHQVKYQKVIESQIDEALNKLKSGEYQTISDYLEESYGTGFTSSLYRLQKQGIPLIFPMNRNEIIKAVQLNSKISGGLYKRLGINTKAMKNAIRQEVTRGISSSMSSADIARNIDNRMNSGLYNSYRIARTEGHRINQEASFDAMKKAKEAGADVVKQWDSTLDGRTRPHHRMLDGQVRELEDPFEVDGLQAQYPSGFGKASEDINCRCVVLEIGRWELDEDDTYTKFDGNQGVIVKDLSDVTEYATFQKKYYETLLNDAKKQLSSFDVSKQYSGIWRNDVTIADYSAKKSAIQAKKDYFLDQISNGNKVAQFQKALDDLDEFEREGIKFEAVKNRILDIQSKVKKQNTRLGIIEDAFSDNRKASALWFDKAHGGFTSADNYFDPPAKIIHSNATSQEKDGFYTYTQGSGGHNRPLAGFQKPYYESGSGWEDRYYVGSKKVWIDYEGKGNQIRGLTTLIEKSTYDKDVWLQSGQDFATIEGFLGIPKNTLSKMTDAELQQFVGRENVIYNFISTAVNEGGGSIFNSKPLKINFYAPEGTQMLYASDVGAFGKGENEMILQRGGSYKISKMYWGTDATDGGRRKIFVDIEIHPEKGYDLFQQDPNEWKGSKKNYRS